MVGVALLASNPIIVNLFGDIIIILSEILYDSQWYEYPNTYNLSIYVKHDVKYPQHALSNLYSRIISKPLPSA